MNFGPWFPLDEAASHAPAEPGVLQARAQGLRAYPRGKSAMVLYASCGADESLDLYVVRQPGEGALARARAQGARWIRFATSRAPEMESARLLRQFAERFGALPLANIVEYRGIS